MESECEPPKPVITIHGETDLLVPTLQKRLQSRLSALQQDVSWSDEQELSFNALCAGVKFVEFRDVKDKLKRTPLHQQPCLHTYWTACYEYDLYTTYLKKNIEEWLEMVHASDKNAADTFIIYTITAEVRKHRPGKINFKRTNVEDALTKDFKDKVSSVCILRLASSEPTRIAESQTSLVNDISHSTVNMFTTMVSEAHKKIQSTTMISEQSEETLSTGSINPNQLYTHLTDKLSLAVCFEMIRHSYQALINYEYVHRRLEDAITRYAYGNEDLPWLKCLQEIKCTNWDYPKFMDPQTAWKFLSPILDNTAHVLQMFTFLLARQTLLFCRMGQPEQVYSCCVSTLHCTARTINHLKLSLPAGAYDSWTYMTCLECVEAMMLQIDPEVLANTQSVKLILIRAVLWSYAWDKLGAIGILCDLMPGVKSSTPNKDAIDVICSGITICVYDDEYANDQGKRLIGVLKSKEAFKNAFMTLGETVIGAFKHAGRRRTAFSIGTRMSQFHRDVGMMKEAEKLLFDVVSLHSVQRWPQLSSSAYSILASCQKHLKQEDKEVNSLLVLVTTPPVEQSSHHPDKCMDQLLRIANVSCYQKLLSWEPLFDLESLSLVRPVVGGGFRKGDPISVTLLIKFNGPKEMKLTIAQVLLDSKAPSVALPTGSAAQPSFSHDLLGEICLDPGPEESELLDSRPIGGDAGSKVHKVYYSTAQLHSKQSGAPNIDSVLLTSNDTITLMPGENTFVVTGKAYTPGNYYPCQITLKCGALDFTCILPPKLSLSNGVTVLPEKIDITVSLVTESKVILAGVSELSQLILSTGEEMSVPSGSCLRIVAPPGVELESPDEGASVSTNDGCHELSLALPSIAQSSSTTVHFDFTVDSVREHQKLPESSEGYNAGRSELTIPTWQYKLEAHCDWLKPPHAAHLPLSVYEPFAFSHQEHSAGSQGSFVQLMICNTCPLPLRVSNPQLHTDVRLSKTAVTLPEIVYPGDSFSLIWKARKNNNNIDTLARVSATFQMSYRPLEESGKKRPSLSTKYHFYLSNMETFLSVQAALKPRHGSQSVMVGQPSRLVYVIKNISWEFRDSSQKQPKLHYFIRSSPKQWSVLGNTAGTLQAPPVAGSVNIEVMAEPMLPGTLALPLFQLMFEKPESQVSGGDGASAYTIDRRLELITSAQCYNYTQWQTAEVLDTP